MTQKTTRTTLRNQDIVNDLTMATGKAIRDILRSTPKKRNHNEFMVEVSERLLTSYLARTSPIGEYESMLEQSCERMRPFMACFERIDADKAKKALAKQKKAA